MRSTIIKCHGGKFYLSDFILEKFPKNYQNLTYIEPFCGGSSVLLRKQVSDKEIINDLDYGLIQIYKNIRENVDEFVKVLKTIIYTKETFLYYKESNDGKEGFERGVSEYVLRRMSRGGIGRDFSWSDRKRGGLPENINAWNKAIINLPNFSDRLKNVTILNKNAVDIITRFNGKDSLLYLDPPYVKRSRVAKSIYRHEMSDIDHINLRDCLCGFTGKVILSGYDSEIYDELYSGWKTFTKEIKNNSGQNKIKTTRREKLWLNYE